MAARPESAGDSRATPLPIKSGNIDDLLDQARTAFSERRYTDPRPTARSSTSRCCPEPDNGEALEGLSRIIGVLNERLETALSENRTDDAASAIAQLKLAETDPARLRGGLVVGAQISGALDSDNVDRAAACCAGRLEIAAVGRSEPRFHNDLERRQADARVDRMADLVATRIRQGRLVDPANDSAQYYLAQLRKLPGSAERSAAAARDLDAAMRDRSRRDTRTGRCSPGRERSRPACKLVRDRTPKGGCSSLRRTARFIISAPAHRRHGRQYLCGGIERRFGAPAHGWSERADRRQARRGPGQCGSGASARRESSDVDALERGVAAARPRRLRRRCVSAGISSSAPRFAPEYPRDAVQQGIEGSVRVRFTIGTGAKSPKPRSCRPRQRACSTEPRWLRSDAGGSRRSS